MTEQAPHPAALPGSDHPTGAMVAAIYGDLTPHPWLPADLDTDDALTARMIDHSMAMGWLDGRGPVPVTAGQANHALGGAPGLWVLNDAGREHPHGSTTPPLVAWFHANIRPVHPDRPLPTEPFLRCAGDALNRIGHLTVQAVQILLPIQMLDTSPRLDPVNQPSLLTSGRFHGGDPTAATDVVLSLDSGQDPWAATMAARLCEQAAIGDPPILVLHEHLPTDTARIAPPFGDWLWKGPPLHRVTARGTLAEWSLDTVGWLGAHLADQSALNGGTCPALFTIRRDDPAFDAAVPAPPGN